MIYLLYGSDIHRSREKLNEIINEFRSRAGSSLNYYNFDAEEETPERIKNVLGANSLFAAKKLVVLKYFSASPHKEELYKTLESAKDDPQTTVVLWDRELGGPEPKRLAGLCKKTQEFKAEKRNLSEISVFELGDTFFTSTRSAFRSLLGLLSQGHDDFNLFSYLANHARTILAVKSYAAQGRGVPASSGIHPYVVKKVASLANSFSSERLRYFLHRFFKEDHRIKTGLSRPQDSLMRMLLEKGPE